MKLFLSLCLSLTFLSSFSQSDKNVESHQFKINFINPGLEYEIRIAKNQTIDLGAGLQFGFRDTNDGLDWVFVPAFNLQYRYYTNMQRRLEKGKSISGNSGNYIALANTTFLNERIIGNTEVSGGYFGFVGPVYGIQRTYAKGFNFSLKFGAGYYYDDFYDGEFGPILGFSIGWVLDKNR